MAEMMSAAFRVDGMMGVPAWIEVLRVANALGDMGAIDAIRIRLVRMIKNMYNLDGDDAIMRYNIMIESYGSLDHIRSTEVQGVLAGL